MISPSQQLTLSHAQLVALYVVLSRHEAELDPRQAEILEDVADRLYAELSVSQMEEIDAYYQGLAGP